MPDCLIPPLKSMGSLWLATQRKWDTQTIVHLTRLKEYTPLNFRHIWRIYFKHNMLRLSILLFVLPSSWLAASGLTWRTGSETTSWLSSCSRGAVREPATCCNDTPWYGHLCRYEYLDCSEEETNIVDEIDFSHSEAIKMLKTIYGHRAEEIMLYRWQLIKYGFK